MDIILIVNIITIVFMAILVIKGIIDGFLMQLISFLGLITACLVSAYINPVLCNMFDLWPHSWAKTGTIFDTILYSYFNKIAWFLIIVLILLLIFALLKPLVSFVQKIPVIKQINGLAGGIFGFIMFIFWVYIISLVLNLPMIKNGHEIVDNTLLGKITNVTTFIVHKAEEPLKQSEMFTKLINGEIESDEDKEWLINFMYKYGLDELPIEQFTQGDNNE